MRVRMSSAPLLPAATFPPLTWFQLAKIPGATICVHENYVKQSLRNRIALVNTRGAVDFTFPVHRRLAASRGVQDLLFTDEVCPEALIKVLRTNCGSAPFFEHYLPDLEDWAFQHLHPGKPWLDAALASLHWACEELGQDLPGCSSSYESGDNRDDWRLKNRWRSLQTPRYPQVFEDRLGFVPGRSILDVLFHVGPEAALLPSRHGNHDAA
jgi:hypothetical protein